MSDILSLAADTLISPIILSFALGLLAALFRSELTVPEAVAKAMSIYLLFAIGFKGGVSVSESGLTSVLVWAIIAGFVLSAVMPLLAFGLLQAFTRLDRINAAAIAAHYGSISIVTFVTATSVLERQGISSEGFMVAVAAVMEAPAILTALYLVFKSPDQKGTMDSDLWREILLNGSIVLLVGAFFIGAITGTEGLAQIESFIVAPFTGVLCLFLLDMGLVAGRGLRNARGDIGLPLFAFSLVMPLLGATLGLGVGWAIGLSTGGVALLMTLAASASYIAVPAAMRVALPDANPSLYLTCSLGFTFPFNLTVGIPIFVATATAILGT
ncbi:MAG: sodium-dependent bicarbonate transport family permease [Pseudomonadota bacterium]